MAGMETFKGNILHLSLPSQKSTTFSKSEKKNFLVGKHYTISTVERSTILNANLSYTQGRKAVLLTSATFDPLSTKTPTRQKSRQTPMPRTDDRQRVLWCPEIKSFEPPETHMSGRSAIFCTSFHENQLTESLKHPHAHIRALPLFSDSQGCWGNSTQVRTFSPDSGSISVWKVSRGWDWFSDSQSALSRSVVRVKGR